MIKESLKSLFIKKRGNKFYLYHEGMVVFVSKDEQAVNDRFSKIIKEQK